MTQPRLEMRGISKRYGGVRAIRQADLVVPPGSVHALVGENGAGKSTLIKILAGAEQADTGTVSIDGDPVRITSTGEAIGLGVQTVYQEPHLFQDLSVAENFFVGREMTAGLVIDWKAQAPRMFELFDLVGLDRRVAALPMRRLSIAQQQLVSIAKALLEDARILILDEPSAILTQNEIDVLFGVYISHRLDELFQIADTVTVMRDGSTVSSDPIEDLSVRVIAERMVGGELSEGVRTTSGAGDPMLVLDGLTLEGAFEDVSLTVHRGEIVGLYGLVGSGAAEVGDVVYGIRQTSSGTIRIGDRSQPATSPAQAKRRGVRMVPANRSQQGTFAFQSIAFNIGIGSLPKLSSVAGWVSPRTERGIARRLIERLAIKTPNERVPVRSMSGGNAQKVVLARQLVQRPEVLVLAEPTQGVDVGAKEEIHRIVSELADQGTAVLVITTDLGEVLRISDRILVFRAGAVAAELAPTAGQAEVLALAAGEAGQEAS